MTVAMPETRAPARQAPAALDIEATDVTGQRAYRLRNFPPDRPVRELLTELLGRMRLTQTDARGAPLRYRLRHEGHARYLHASEVAGDVLESGDQVSVHPHVDAG